MAILCIYKQNKLQLDAVIFADPGSEMPETYDYIEKVVKPLCTDLGLPFITVGKPTLYQDYWKKKVIPYRLFRSCTDKYKIRPINKYCKKMYGDYTMIIGIDYGEKKRAKQMKGVEYPLVELQINRNGCKKIIQQAGLPVPTKSGCFFCPFMNKEGWKKLFDKYPDMFRMAEDLEKNCKAYPKYFLGPQKLEEMRKAFISQTQLFTGSPERIDRCLFCHD